MVPPFDAGSADSEQLEDLALRLLRHLADLDRDTASQGPNRLNLLNAVADGRPRSQAPGRRGAVYAVAEAWALLEGRSALAPDPTQPKSEFFFVTRLGFELAENGLG